MQQDKELQQAVAEWNKQQDKKAKIGDIIMNTLFGGMFLLVVSVIIGWSRIL
jgi:hypothetical protein